MRMLSRLLIVCLICSVVPAMADTIDFESGGPVSPVDSFVLGGVTFSTLGTPGGGMLFVVGGAPNGTQALLDNNSPRRTIRADFASLVDFVSIDLGDFNQDADTLWLRAYNSSDVLLGSASESIDENFNGMKTLSLLVAGISYVTFGAEAPAGDGNSAYADNLTFRSGADVPEPATLSLLLVGLAGLKFARRKPA